MDQNQDNEPEKHPSWIEQLRTIEVETRQLIDPAKRRLEELAKRIAIATNLAK